MIVEINDSGKRIDKYLNENTEYTRSKIQKMIENGNILVNDIKVKDSYKVKENDYITIEALEETTDILPENIPLDIYYEDDDLIVVNKPSGMVVHPAPGNYTGTLVNALIYHTNNLSKVNTNIRPGIVHRIDKDTSGIIIVAKNDKAHLNISEQIKEHKTTKTYLALVRGRVKENEATIDMPIGRSKKDRKKMAVDKYGKKAVTHFKVLKRYSDCTLLEVVIETGRTHQIRVHLSEIGYPIIGDYTYSNGKNRFDVEGQMLHAYKIKFKHPTTNEEVEYTAELPKYFKDILEKLDEE